jgi:hypothetical protein
MQAPSKTTPTAVCFRLSLYHRKMLERFAEHQALLARIGTAESQYRSTHDDYESAVLALVETRVRVRIADYFADQRAKLLELAARGADGGRAGPITKKLFPEGLRTIVQPVGPSEVTELRKLEVRLNNAGGPLAAEHLPALVKVREEYEAALAERHDGLARVGAKRELRNAAKGIWLDMYSRNQGAVREAYPRDKAMQNLFFDDFRGRAAAPPDEDVGAPAPAPTPA